jgi:hypothetical protein
MPAMTDPTEKKKKPTLGDTAKAEKAAREARLAQALRDNLRRRRKPGAGERDPGGDSA